MKRASQVLMFAGLMLLVTVQAQAQMLQWSDRIFLNVNYGMQSKADAEVKSGSTWTIYEETASSSVSQPIQSSGGGIDVSGGFRLFGSFGVGAGYFSVNKKAAGTVSASVPHPLYFDRPRTATASVDGLVHKETALNLMGLFVLPIGEKFDLALSAGPTFFSLEQDTLVNPTIGAESSPYSTISLATITKVTTKKNKTGFNAGVDATFKVTRHIGIGGFVRYAKAKVEYTPEGSKDLLSIDVGGMQYGGGLRIRF